MSTNIITEVERKTDISHVLKIGLEDRHTEEKLSLDNI